MLKMWDGSGDFTPKKKKKEKKIDISQTREEDPPPSRISQNWCLRAVAPQVKTSEV